MKKKVLSAIDSFKGCLTSAEANEAASQGLKKAFPDADVACYQVSDGGEGFLEAMQPDEIMTCHVHDPLMRWRDAAFGIKNGIAIIEVAKAVGLTMVEPENRNPLTATSYGVGELMVHALRRGCKEFVIGLGGVATSDCGLGMLKALKKEWQAQTNKMWYDPFDTSWLQDIKVTLATDVKNPLYGPNGAAHVFARQKGADAAMIEQLDRRARTFAVMAAKHQGRDCANKPGAGAAGGLGYAFMEFMDANVESGADLVLQSSGFDDALSASDKPLFVVTGEGSADAQTLMGKLPSVILKHCKAKQVPVTLLAGRIKDRKKLLEAGFERVIDINEGLDMTHAMDKEVAALRIEKALCGK